MFTRFYQTISHIWPKEKMQLGKFLGMTKKIHDNPGLT